MAKLVERPCVKLEANLLITEPELRALEELSQFSPSDVTRVLGENIGGCFSGRHAAALEAFLLSIREFAPQILKRADAARKAFEK